MEVLKKSTICFCIYTVALGMVYPAVITGVGQILFRDQANGSPVVSSSGQVVGSKLIGQNFKGEKYFIGRPSSTAPTPYNPQSSSGSNMSLTNPALKKAFEERAAALGNGSYEVPADLISSSGSGLDPEISIAAAKFQIPRIAKVRGVSEEALQRLVDSLSAKRQFGVIGEPRINVLRLNMELDKL